MRKGVIMPVTLGMLCTVIMPCLITKYSHWDSLLIKRQNLDPEKALWEHPYIGLSKLLLCSFR